MIRITINRKQLMAALLIAAKKDFRYYLNGVYVEASATETRIVATNGHALCAQRFIPPDGNLVDGMPVGSVDGLRTLIIPYAVAAGVKNNDQIHTVDVVSYGLSWSLQDGSVNTDFAPVEGKFPEYRNSIPLTTNGKYANYDQKTIGLFAKAAVVLGCIGFQKRPAILISSNGGSDAGLVSMSENNNFVGVIMPVKGETAPTEPHGWARAGLQVPHAE